jgi:hypothetical protein
MSIIGGLITCQYGVDWDSLDDDVVRDPSKFNLYCKQDEDEPIDDDPQDGNLIPYDEGCLDGRGWSWADDSYEVIQLCERMCEEMKDGGCPVITATFGCKSRSVV